MRALVPISVALFALGFAGRSWSAEALPSDPAHPKTLVSEEEKWVFNPPTGRVDIFYDEEQRLVVMSHINAPVPKDPTQPVHPNPVDDVLEVAKAGVQQIESYVSQRKWEEALRVVEQLTKRLQTEAVTPDITKYLQVIKGYQDQIQDALLRDEAQAAFDALNLKVEGILWSENGPRLALISGEPRALGVNDRVKDCVIINIDTDRVDFRYHYKRKRFEFPRYVGEDSKSK